MFCILGGYIQQFSGFTSGFLLKDHSCQGLGKHLSDRGLNPGWLCVRQTLPPVLSFQPLYWEIGMCVCVFVCVGICAHMLLQM